jgi:glycosyltransferase involved in cell wall biosynthesis
VGLDGAVTTTSSEVLLCTNSAVLGGAEQLVLALARGLPELGWQTMIAVHDNDQLADAARRADVAIARSPSFHDDWGGARLLLPWLSFVRRRAPDLVHVHLTWPFATRVPIVAALALRVPVVLSVHSFPPFEASQRDLIIWRRLVNRTVACLAVSDDIASKLAGRLGWDPARIRVVHPGVDVGRFAGATADQGLRRRLLGAQQKTLALYVGRLDHLKGVETLLTSLEGVRECALAIVGDGPERGKLELQARPLGDRVTFLGQRLDIETLMASADLLVLPSRTEGLPVVVLEAMAAGLPVVATSVGGIPEAVVDGETGLLVPPENPVALAAAIRRMSGDSLLRVHVVTGARHLVEARFAVDRMVVNAAAAYAGARRRRNRPRASRTAARSSAVEPKDE